MRHRFHHKKLNRTSEHRKSLIKNMLNSLIKYEQISTTLPKAKVLKPHSHFPPQDPIIVSTKCISKVKNIPPRLRMKINK